MSAFPFWVISFESKNKALNQKGFNKSLSSTCILKSNQLYTFLYDKFAKAYYSSETMTVDSNTIQNFYFLLAMDFKDTPITIGTIGLDIHSRIYFETPGSNFIEKLKKNNIIDSYYFAIKYNNDDDNKEEEVGELVVGKYPHEIDSSLSKKDLISVQPLKIGHHIRWGINLDEVKCGGAVFSNKATAVIKIEVALFIGPFEYYNYITNTFFNELIQRNQCRLQQFIKNLQGFVCSKDIDLSKFEDLKFKKGNTVFTFTSKELFREELGQKVLMVVFSIKNYFYESADWTLGEIFLKKYLFVFNQDKKTLEFYSHKNELLLGDDEGLSFITILLMTSGIILGILSLFLIFKSIHRKLTASKTIIGKEFNGLLSKDFYKQ